MSVSDETMMFKKVDDEPMTAEQVLTRVYESMKEKGYNPINQIVGYLMSGDPGYITSYKDARSKLTSISPAKILEVIVKEAIK